MVSGCDSIKEVYERREKESMSLIRELRRLVSESNTTTISESNTEKTGFIGWFTKFRMTIGWFVAGVVVSTIFWFLMRLIGKV